MKIKLLKIILFISTYSISCHSFSETFVSIKYTSASNPKRYKLSTNTIHYLDREDIKSLTIEGPKKYKVYQQTETSVTIMNEGPHQDLTNWKHGRSNFIELTGHNNEYLFIDQTESIEFPKVDLAELVSEAKKIGGARWAEIAKNCKSPQEYPCGVAPSKYIFKIMTEKNKQWIDEGIIVFIPPMGC